FVQLLPVEVNRMGAGVVLDSFTGEPDYPFNEVRFRSPWEFEYDYIAPPDLPLREDREIKAIWSKDKFIDQQVILYPDCILHRAGGNLDRLHDEGHAEQGHDQSHYRRLKILARQALLKCSRV